MYYFWGKGFTFKEIQARVKKLIKQGEEYINKEFKTFEYPFFNLNQWPLTKNEKIIIKGFKKATYAFNFADEVTNYYIYHLRPLFDEIAKRLKISYEELVSMRFSEIKESLQKHQLVVAQKKLKERFKDHALIFTKRKVYVLSGGELEQYRKLNLVKEKPKEIKEFKGVIAFQGKKIKGRVRIIKSDEKVKYFQKGEILAAQMTNPTYVPAMEKAAAIITDEGGLLCHAAIIARELGIPCVIGTKIATKVLKDGDLVEVDAEKGVVRVLKRVR